MAKADYYDTLGVGRDVDPSALKSAYRKLAMRYHPDRNPDNKEAETRFKEVSEAYDILKDPEKRAQYDRFGHAAFEGGGTGDFDFNSGFADIFDEMFGDFMGGGGGRRRSSRGADLRYNMEVSLEEAFHGREAQIRIPAMTGCDDCDGTGAAKGSRPVSCGTCHGRGKVRAQQGFFTIERTCPTCQGSGRTIENPCHTCQGGGRVRREKSLKVTIPAGVEDGTRIRLAGEGEFGTQGTAAGDLYIFISVSPHRVFQRDGADLLVKVPIPMTTAALGGSIQVPSIDGRHAKLSVEPGVQTGRQFRLRGKGMSVLHGRDRGDMYINIIVETPVNLSSRQKELLKQFGEEKPAKGETTNPQSESFFSRMREFWDDLTD